MNIILEGLNTVSADQYAFIRKGFLAGRTEGAWPDWRNSPTEEEMVALAIDDSGPIGFATFYHAGDVERVWLDLLWVTPERRRESIGTRLVAAVLAYGGRHRLAVEFGALADNATMQALAASFGLKPSTIGYRWESLAA